MGMVFLYGVMGGNMRESLLKIRGAVLGFKCGQMGGSTRDNGRIINRTERGK